ncbi:MAG TPA: choline/ethanolamine kinase family protein [Kiloniellales bacterium]|jgi:thiamine kinase-like enzyme
MDEVEAALARIPDLAGLPRKSLTWERLGGLTNRVYRVVANDAAYALRIPGEGTGDYIDRKVEAHNARVAANAGVGAEVIFCDESDGLMLTRFLEGAVTMSPAHFRDRSGAPARAAKALKRMHTCGQAFQFRFELFSMIDSYRGLLKTRDAQLPFGYDVAVAEAESVRPVLDLSPPPLAPCHCDPLAENFLDDGARMWIVDWEYSGMNDPIWDLGDVSVEAEFDEAQDREMMTAYCDGPAPAAIYGRMIIYKAMCDLLWTLWGLIQHADNNPAEDFWAYATRRFARCTALMNSERFVESVAAVKRNG